MPRGCAAVTWPIHVAELCVADPCGADRAADSCGQLYGDRGWETCPRSSVYAAQGAPSHMFGACTAHVSRCRFASGELALSRL
eukprot:5706061-Prymnesium_polylepis.1